MIPGRIHQYWDKEEAPDAVLKARNELATLNPEHTTVLWSHRTANAYLEKYFGNQIADVFSRCKMPAMQSDFFRYCVLLNEGGIYIDSDDRLKVPFDKWLDRSADIALPMVKITDPKRRGLSNCLIASRPHNPILAFAVGECINNILLERDNNVWAVTGPRVLISALYYKRKLQAQLIDPRDAYVNHFSERSVEDTDHWSKRQQSESIFLPTETSTELSPEAAISQLQQANKALHESCGELISMGISFSQFEYELESGGPWQAHLETLTTHRRHFDFEELENEPPQCSRDHYQRIADWRTRYIGENLILFERRAEKLTNLIVTESWTPGSGMETEFLAPGLLFHTAVKLHAQKQHSLATSTIRQAVACSTYQEKIWSLAGQLFLSSEYFKEAENLALAVTKRDPGNMVAQFILARVYENKGQLEPAIEAMRTSLLCGDYVKSIWVAASQFFLRNGLFEEAERTASESRQHEPENQAVLNLLARAFEHLGKASQAAATAEQLVEVSGSLASYILLTRLLLLNGEVDKAKSSLGKALSLFPPNQQTEQLSKQIEAARR